MAREQVWQVWQLPYQCHDWYGTAIPINCSKLPILPILKAQFFPNMSPQTNWLMAVCQLHLHLHLQQSQPGAVVPVPAPTRTSLDHLQKTLTRHSSKNLAHIWGCFHVKSCFQVKINFKHFENAFAVTKKFLKFFLAWFHVKIIIV